MKELIEITQSESVAVNRLMYRYPQIREGLKATNIMIRYRFGNTTILIEAFADKDGYHFKGHEEASALLMKPTIPNFDFSGVVINGEAKITKFPKYNEALKWLAQRNNKRTNAGEIMYIATHCFVAINKFKELLHSRVVGDTIEYRFPKDFEYLAEGYIAYNMAKDAKEHLLDGWDVVNLTENQYYKVIETNQQNKVEYDMENIPLPRFCLAIYDGKETDYYFYEQKGRTIKCTVCDPGTYITQSFELQITGKTADGIGTTLHVDDKNESLWNWLNEVITKDGDTNWEWIADTFFIINTFMLHFGDVTMEVETKETHQQEGQNRQQRRANKRNSVRLFKSYKLIKNWKSQARKKAEITCPAWGVRGHFRHLRNGKVIFVEAYVKGKEKDKYKGKEYNLLPYKEA